MQECIEDMIGDNHDESMMTISEVARFLNVHVNTLRRWSERGIIVSYRIGPRGDRRFPREAIARFLTELHASGGDERKAGSSRPEALARL